MSSYLLWVMPLQECCCKMSYVFGENRSGRTETKMRLKWESQYSLPSCKFGVVCKWWQNFLLSFNVLPLWDIHNRFSKRVTSTPHQKGGKYCRIILPRHKRWKKTQTVEGWPFCHSFVGCHFLLSAHSHKPVNLPLPCLAATIQLWFFQTSRSDCQPPPLTLSRALVSEMSVGKGRRGF